MVVNQKILREIIKKNFQADIREAGMFSMEGVDPDLFSFDPILVFLLIGSGFSFYKVGSGFAFTNV